MTDYTSGHQAEKGTGRSRRLHTPQEVIDALMAHGCKGEGERWQCPAHTGKDKDLNLSVTAAPDGIAKLKCFSHHCTTTDILKAIGLLGERVKTENEKMGKPNGKAGEADPLELVADDGKAKAYNPPHNAIAQYDYADAEGQPVGTVWRVKKKDGKKSFRQATALGGDRWTVPAPERWPLFRLADVLEADPAKPVVVVEGEKTALALAKLGYVATTWAGGSNKGAVAKTDFSPLTDREVILCPDRDDPGRKAMNQVSRIISGSTRRLRQIEVPEGPDDGWTWPTRPNERKWTSSFGPRPIGFHPTMARVILKKSTSPMTRTLAPRPNERPPTCSSPPRRKTGNTTTTSACGGSSMGPVGWNATARS